MSSRTSLAQRNQFRTLKSSLSSGVNLTNQVSSAKKLPINFPIDTHANLTDELNSMHILDKFNKYQQFAYNQAKDSYKGDLKGGKKDGFGIYTFKNGDQYIGYFDNDKMHGMGLYRFNIDSETNQRYVYSGQFAQGSFNGIGKLILLKTEREGYVVYQGFWAAGLKHGHGVYFYSLDTSIYYDGHWQNDMKNGEGRLIFQNGQYSGNWQNDQKHGQGKLRIQHPQRNLIYEGEWFNDQIKNGEINYISNGPDASVEGVYKGQIKNGKKHGKGTFESKNSSVTGQFEDDVFTGKGRLHNDIYSIEGDFNSKQNLKGKIKYTNEDIFEGILELQNNLVKRKQGKYLFANEDLVEGKFDDQGSGDLFGLFQYMWKNGQRKKIEN